MADTRERARERASASERARADIRITDGIKLLSPRDGFVALAGPDDCATIYTRDRLYERTILFSMRSHSNRSDNRK